MRAGPAGRAFLWALAGWVLLSRFAVANGMETAGADEMGHPETLVLATYNVRNYLEQNRWYAGQYRFGHPKPEAEKEHIREVIRAANADVLFLQEIGSAAHLEELRRDLEAEGSRYQWSHFSASDEGRTGLAVLSKRALGQALLAEPRDTRQAAQMRRGLHEVVIPFGGAHLRVLHVHLKSRYTVDTDDPEAAGERAMEIGHLAEAGRIRARVWPQDWILLAGDFNTPFEEGLMDSLRTFGAPVEASDPEGGRWTYHHLKRDHRERIDGFWTQKGGPDGAVFAGLGIYPSIHESKGSDHRLVAIRATISGR